MKKELGGVKLEVGTLFQISSYLQYFFRQEMNLLLGNNLSLIQFKYEVRESPKIFVMHYLQLILQSIFS